ncbi:hypothetical protein GCM10010123_22920 [Pilimelia anulata]|uniref:3,5-dihydroxyphenylacetyl-CoA monooxygenase n=1 Tax=Pilimelia anulata TaxID=53371 RepID=A0A8J3F893_9ACTN|nr:(3,5-dihydroxyphenyl)acetyl-CoA 1,2-dioxygenase DpgC [Pilimelia anulata]GGJ92467.1 hypothetical protein GCM10010123_22920 [Pilimelia anulata]
MSRRSPEPVGALPAAREVTAAAAAVDELLAGLAPPERRSTREHEAVAAVQRAARRVKAGFLRAHTDRLYDEVTAGRTRALDLAALGAALADAVPGLLPGPAELAAERERPPAAKRGWEVDQGIVYGHLLAADGAGPHLVAAQRRPTARARELLPRLAAAGAVDLRSVRVEVRAGAAHLTMQRADCLNAEDDEQVDDMETAVDLALLSPAVRVGVLRGGVMTHPKYAGRRVFSAGINLKSLHAGRISFTGFLLRRELGYVAKLVHGLSGDDPAEPDVQKPWLAAVDTFAIGGGAQLLLACDRVVAERDAYFSLPAAAEGIIPGCANLRLGRAVGSRLARQIVLAGRRIAAAEPAGALLFDEVVPAADLDRAVEAGVALLDGAAVVTNRRMLNLADEPPELFRRYVAEFALQQARRMHSADVLGRVGRFAAGAAPAPAGALAG